MSRLIGRRGVLIAVVLVLLLGLALVVTDTVLTRRVQSRVSTALRCAAGDGAAAPEVSFGRTPLLFQLVTGSVGFSLTTGWDAVADRITSAEDAPAALAGATVGARDGQLLLTLSQQLMGEPVQVLMTLGTDGDSLVLIPETVVLGERQVRAELLSRFGGASVGEALQPRTVPLQLPTGVRLGPVDAEDEGLTVHLSADPGALPERAERSGRAGTACAD